MYVKIHETNCPFCGKPPNVVGAEYGRREYGPQLAFRSMNLILERAVFKKSIAHAKAPN
jgi:hypothetical protein